MGLLEVIGGLLGSGGTGNWLATLLGDGPQQNSNGTADQGGTTGAGIGGLISMFEQAGLGHVAQSWVSNGPNQPVSPQQLQTVFGEDRVQSMASQSGMQPQDFLSQLSQHLPNAVNDRTPNGRLPDEGTVSV